MPAQDIDLTVQLCVDLTTVPAEEKFRAWVVAALHECTAGQEITIRIVDETESRALNRQYREQDRPTNVLSFPADLPAGVDCPWLGDLVICGPVLEREAQARGLDLQAHWAHLVIHGVLHLLGHDHQQDDHAARMEGLETSILAALGYADPYRHAG